MSWGNRDTQLKPSIISDPPMIRFRVLLAPMPHTSRRSKASAGHHSKISYVKDKEGWSHVTRNNHMRSAQESHTRVPTTHGISFNNEELKCSFDRIQHLWQTSDTKETLTRLIRSHSKWQGISDSVCLGLGSMSAGANSLRKDSMWQLVVWLSIIDSCSSYVLSQVNDPQLIFSVTIDEKGNPPVKLFAQDPCFTDIDKDFLGSCDINTLCHPKAYENIQKNTFVFAPHFPHFLWPETMCLGLPCLMICNALDDDCFR